MKTVHTEALVIGSGFGAAAPAYRLSQAGVQVLMIEKGKNIVPEENFKQTQDPKYLLQYLKSVSSETVSFIFAEGLGGGSGFYEMVSLRAPSRVFGLADANGTRLWPRGVNRETLDPYYDLAEEMLHVEQIGIDEIPKSGAVFSLMMKNLGYSCDRARYAVKGCVGSGYCVSGCVFGAKQSLHLNYLPQTREAGAQILTEVEALSIRSLSRNETGLRWPSDLSAVPYRYEVRCRTADGEEEFAIRAKMVILGGGTVGTAKLLLNSREKLPLLSDHVGKNISFNGFVKTAGLLPEGFVEGDMLSGRSHPGMISYEFLDSMGITVSSAKPLPLQVITTAKLVLDNDAREPNDWGEANVELMKLYRRRMIVLYALGLTPPTAELLHTGPGTFKPYLRIDDNIRRYYNETKKLLHSIFTRNGCKILQAHGVDREGKEYEDLHFATAHMIGSCRMADSKDQGVVDAYGEVFDYPGLYITDGAAIPSSLAVNSSLTILANAERIAVHLARIWGKESSRVVAAERPLQP